jgi:hypothetical protein
VSVRRDDRRMSDGLRKNDEVLARRWKDFQKIDLQGGSYLESRDACSSVVC